MGNIVTNDALGRIAEKMADGGDIILIPLSASDTDALMKDGYATPSFLDDFLGDAANTEQTTTWSRKAIANASVVITIDDSTDQVRVELPDQVFSGPTAGNDTVSMAICLDGASDAVREVLTVHDFAVTADGNDVTADFNPATGFWNTS